MLRRIDRGGPAQVSDSTCRSGDPTKASTTLVDRACGEVREQDPLACVGQREVGVHVDVLSSLVGISATVSISGPRSRSGWSSAAPSLRGPEERRLDQDEGAAAEVLGQERHVRQLEHATE